MEILVILMVLAATALFVMPPLFRREEGAPSAASTVSPSVADAMSRRDAAYEALSDLELDHASGKLSEADFARLKLGLQKDAVAALRDLDALLGQRQPVPRDPKR